MPLPRAAQTPGDKTGKGTVPRLRRAGGFTLLEVLVAVGILCIGILAVGSMYVTAMQKNYFSGHVTEGDALAQEQLEVFLRTPYDELVPGSGQTVQGEYTVSWDIADATPLPLTRAITVTVTWPERGLTRRVALTLIRSML